MPRPSIAQENSRTSLAGRSDLFHFVSADSAPERASSVACAAANRAIGTRNGEQET